MFCTNCGKEISHKNAKFCSYCGFQIPNLYSQQAVSAVQPPNAALKTKFFHFNIFKNSDMAVGEINNWLNQQKIIINSVQCGTAFNANCWNPQTVLCDFTITYFEDGINGHIYQMDHMHTKKYYGVTYEVINRLYDNWVKSYPDFPIVWKRFCGHQIDASSTQAVYFIYVLQ